MQTFICSVKASIPDVDPKQARRNMPLDALNNIINNWKETFKSYLASVPVV